jgi:hypothetical protein
MSIKEWLPTAEMAAALGIHPKTLNSLRRRSDSPFKEGTHYRHAGATTGAPIQWFVEPTDEAFTNFKRTPARDVEAFSEVEEG